MNQADEAIGTLRTSVGDRLAAGLGTAIVIGSLGYMLLRGLTVEMQARGERTITLLNILAPPPPPRQRPKPHVQHPKTRAAARGAPSPRNRKNKRAEVVHPPPLILPPVPPLLISAPKAGPGMAASAGASDRPGPGEGAGGAGNGTGGGGNGNGEGGDLPPRLIKGRLKFSDLPADLRAAGIGGSVSVRYHVEIDGRVSDCDVTGSSGSAELDRLTCQLIEQRFRFEPSRDQDGRPVRSIIVEKHSWVFGHDADTAPSP